MRHVIHLHAQSGSTDDDVLSLSLLSCTTCQLGANEASAMSMHTWMMNALLY